MAPGTRSSQLGPDFDMHNDSPETAATTSHRTSSSNKNRATVLAEIPANHVANVSNYGVDAIATELENFHICSPAKENIIDKAKDKDQARRSYPSVEPQPLVLPSTSDQVQQRPPGDTLTRPHIPGKLGSKPVQDSAKHNLLAAALDQLPTNQEQFARHYAGQFEWVLSVPTHGSDMGREIRSSSQPAAEPPVPDKLYFGCNLIYRAASGGSMSKSTQHADTYTLIATQIEGDEEESTVEGTTIAGVTDKMMTAEVTDHNTTVIRIVEPPNAEIDHSQMTTPEDVLPGKRDGVFEPIAALSPAIQPSRIEDSVEALDRLEEELEALNEVTRLGTVLSPESVKAPAASIDAALLATSARVHTEVLAKKLGVKSGSSSVRIKTVQRAPSLRKSSSMIFSKEDAKQAATNLTPKQSTLTRPPSLLTPKPAVKSSKPLTRPTFELPGEAIGRRLKEEREKRLSKQVMPESPAQAAAATVSPARPHAKSTKPPTRPTFELPGEAISRRKREEREAKLKLQEEEERKRREFKARPLRLSIMPSTLPRETIASKARQNKAVAQPENVPGHTPVAANKRHQLTPAPAAQKQQSLTPPVAARGRTSVAGALSPSGEANINRATSSSTGSIHDGKPSMVSAEDAQQQRQRGREIYTRDNSLTTVRERERREREAAAKRARQEAAERSRMLSREWAEKQRKK